MEIFGRDVLDRAGRRHRDAAAWLHSWAEVVSAAEWQSLAEVRKDYPSADGIMLQSEVVVTVFNVRGNIYRLLTQISYLDQGVIVLELLTHAEYSKDRWKARY